MYTYCTSSRFYVSRCPCLRKRDAQVKVIKNLIGKARAIMADENYHGNEKRELNLLLKNIKLKKYR